MSTLVIYLRLSSEGWGFFDIHRQTKNAFGLVSWFGDFEMYDRRR